MWKALLLTQHSNWLCHPTLLLLPQYTTGHSVWLFTKNIPLRVESRKLVSQFTGPFTLNKTGNLSIGLPDHMSIHQHSTRHRLNALPQVLLALHPTPCTHQDCGWSSGLYIPMPGRGTWLGLGVTSLALIEKDMALKSMDPGTRSFVFESLVGDFFRENPDVSGGFLLSSVLRISFIWSSSAYYTPCLPLSSVHLISPNHLQDKTLFLLVILRQFVVNVLW